MQKARYEDAIAEINKAVTLSKGEPISYRYWDLPLQQGVREMRRQRGWIS